MDSARPWRLTHDQRRDLWRSWLSRSRNAGRFSSGWKWSALGRPPNERFDRQCGIQRRPGEAFARGRVAAVDWVVVTERLMALKRKNEAPVSSAEWLNCGEVLLALADPANNPSEDLWHAVSSDDRDTAVRAIADDAAIRGAAQAWLNWSRLVASMVTNRTLALSSDEEDELVEHLMTHLAFTLVRKPEVIRVDEPRKPYARSWFSESAASPDGLAQMWRAAVSPPGRRRAASPWIVRSPIAAAGEGTDPRDRIMVDPPWLQGWSLDALCREFVYRADAGIVGVQPTRHFLSTEFQVSLIRLLDGFVKASMKKMAGCRAWFASELLDDEVEGGFSCYWSFWASRKWVRDAAHLAQPLAVSAIPTQIRLDLTDFLKRIAKSNNDHPSQRNRPKMDSVDPADLEAAFHSGR
jgi:hypothetical protein